MAERTMAAMMAGHEKYPATMMATERMPERVVVTTEKMAKKKWSMGEASLAGRKSYYLSGFPPANLVAAPIIAEVRALPVYRKAFFVSHFKFS